MDDTDVFGRDDGSEIAEPNREEEKVKVGITSGDGKESALLRRNHQDSLFTKLYSSKETLLDLYRHIHPSDTGVTVDDIEIITLCSSLVARRYNDVAFKVGDRLMVLTEHQSTPNLNMPLRMLFYVSSEYEKLLGDNRKLIFRDKRIEIPRPEFFVVYTGNKPLDSMLRLSDAYKGEGSVGLELQVNVITKSEYADTLGGYFDTIQFVKEHSIDGHIPIEALSGFIENFRGSELFKQFIGRINIEEVAKMIDIEYDYEVEKEVLKEEGREEGREEGVVLGAIDVYVDLGMDKDTIVTQISKKFELDNPKIGRLLSLYEKRYKKVLR